MWLCVFTHPQELTVILALGAPIVTSSACLRWLTGQLWRRVPKVPWHFETPEFLSILSLIIAEATETNIHTLIMCIDTHTHMHTHLCVFTKLTWKVVWIFRTKILGITSMSIVLEKLIVAQLVKKFSAFYKARRSIAVLKRARHWSPCWAISFPFTL
jgi:hypothetical protein